MVKKANDINLIQHQLDFIQSEARHTGLVAGFGSGKSRAATIKTWAKKMKYPRIDVAYYLPTYSLIEDIAYPNFEELLKQLRIPYQLIKSSKWITTPLGKIIFRSMDNPNYIVGYEVGYSLIDEADILGIDKMKTAVKNIVARNRSVLPNKDPHQLDFVSTPEGFQFMYQFFVKNGSDHRRLIKAKTSDNPYLPDDYIEILTDMYTKEQLAAYLDGEFVNLTSGTIYYNYDRKKNDTKEQIRNREVLHIGMDFNITNMNAVIHVIRNNQPMALAEISGAFDTPNMIEIIKEDYKMKGHSIVVYPDASGEQRSTISLDTDIKLLKKAGFKVIVGKSNPRVKDRITSMNVAFKNSKDIREYLVNAENCPNYTEALEQHTYKNGQPDKNSGHDHITEAAGYFISSRKKKRIGSISAG